jgi:pyrimidine operon attenuation protein/uracil phosphoribosyltransferase
MPDVVQKANSSKDYKNGSVVVSIGTVGVVVNNTIPPKVKQTNQIAMQSGIIDIRFDEVRYYSGDTSA